MNSRFWKHTLSSKVWIQDSENIHCQVRYEFKILKTYTVKKGMNSRYWKHIISRKVWIQGTESINCQVRYEFKALKTYTVK